jgi:hypothetical protein
VTKCVYAAIASVGLVTVAHAGYLDWCGWTDLVARIGAENVPTGAGVIIGQVESEDTNGYYVAFDNASTPAEFDGKYIAKRSGGTNTASSHATMVGGTCYGLDDGLAPGITFINAWTVNGWLGSDYMHTSQGSGTPPDEAMGAQKIWNHSWVGSTGSTSSNTDLLRRLDWVVSRDDVVVVVGLNNGTQQQPLLSYGFNTISVGRRDGDHSSGLVPAPYDGQGRMKPDITGPLYTTSETTATLSAAAAMLVQHVRDDESLPTEGESLEVVKAILMASATHDGASGALWTNGAPDSGDDRGLTNQPIDATVGAGHLDVNRSHLVMAAGQQPGAASGEAAAGQEGWALESISPGEQRSWLIESAGYTDAFSAMITWNRTVASNFGSFTLADMDLELLRLTANNQVTELIGYRGLVIFDGGNVASRSTVDNVEHVYVTGLRPGRYILRVTRSAEDAGGNDIPVGIAWIGEDPVIDADIDGDASIGVLDLLKLLTQWGMCDLCRGDLEGSGHVDSVDLYLLIDAWLAGL